MHEIRQAFCRFCVLGSFPTLLVLLSSSMLSGCSVAPSPASAVHVVLGEIPITRVERNRQWRNARVLPAGNPVTVDVPIESGATVLRFGAFSDLTSESGLSISVQVGERTVVEEIASPKGEWKDFRFNLTNALHPEDTSCRLSFRSDTAFCLHELELVAEKKNTTANVVVFLIDALRSDHLGCYGYGKPTPPHIDRFAADSVRIEGMSAHSSWTRPSVCSLFSSVYPPYHGAQERFDKFSSKGPTIATALGGAGYETYCFMSNPNCLPEWNIGNGFARYVDVGSRTPIPDQDDKNVIDAVIGSLDGLPDRPLFMYVHTMSPHWPYTPTMDYLELIRGTVSSGAVSPIVNGGFDAEANNGPKGWRVLNLQGKPPWRRTNEKSQDGVWSLMTVANAGKPGDVLYAESEPFDVAGNDLITLSAYVSSYGGPNSCATIGVRTNTGGRWVFSARAWAMQSNSWQLVEDSVVVPADTTRASICVYAPKPDKPDSGWFVDTINCTVRSVHDESAGETEFRQHVVDRYDAEIAYVDAQFGRFVEALKSKGLYDNTLIILTSDHGEEFWDHGDTEHAKTLFEEVLSVPFLVKLPNQQYRGTTKGLLAETIDIAPTALDILSIPIPAAFQGTPLSLQPDSSVGPAKELRYAFLKMDGRDLASVKSDSNSLIVDYKKNSEMQYDLVGDPNEMLPSLVLDDRGHELKSELEKTMKRAASGLHIYITFDTSKDDLVDGAVRGVDGRAKGVRVSGYPVELEHAAGESRFTAHFSKLPEEVFREDFVRSQPTHQGHTELVFAVPVDAEIELEVKRNGVPVPGELVFGGRDGKLEPGATGKLNLHDLIAPSPEVEDQIAEGSFGIYVWYIPPASGTSADDLDEEMTDALRSLGYLE